MFLQVLSDQLLRPSFVLVIARAIKLIEIVYRIFEYSFIKNIICSLTFRIFVLALVFSDKAYCKVDFYSTKFPEAI